MVEEPATEADIESLKRGFELFNKGDWDGLMAFMDPEVVLERDGGLPSVTGIAAVREFMEPDAFEWQTLEPLSFGIHNGKVLIELHVRAKGAASGVELDTIGWHVWTFRNGRGVHMRATFDEALAKQLVGLGQNASP